MQGTPSYHTTKTHRECKRASRSITIDQKFLYICGFLKNLLPLSPMHAVLEDSVASFSLHFNRDWGGAPPYIYRIIKHRKRGRISHIVLVTKHLLSSKRETKYRYRRLSTKARPEIKFVV